MYVVLIVDFFCSQNLLYFYVLLFSKKIRLFMTEFAKLFVIQSAYIIRMKKLLVWATKVF